MTAQERQELRELSKKMDDLPNVLIARMDDRYVKKDDGPKQFFTRLEGKAVTTILSIAVVVLTIWNLIRSNS